MTDGAQLKLDGLEAVESNSSRWVDRMRERARTLVEHHGQVVIDDLRFLADRYDDHPHHQNAWGSIFRKGWECIGRRNSTYKSNHAREIKVWRWVG